MSKLTDTFIRNLKSTSTVQKHSDGGGLYLFVSSSGGKLWRMGYRFEGKQKTLSFGAYPAVSLKDARQKRDEAKEQLAKGLDPGEQKKEAKAVALAAAREQAATFEAIGREWHERKTTHLASNHRKQLLSRLENQLFPYIGGIAFSKLEPVDILIAVRHAEDRGAVETAHRLVQLAGQVCRYARVCGYVKYDVASGLKEALQPVQAKHHAALTDTREIGHLLRAIDGYQGDISTIYALRIMPYVFVRSGELRGAKWQEFNLETAEWIVPAGRMKMKRPHTVPLARQVLDLLSALREHSGNGELLFPSPFSASRCISDMALLNAVRRLGYAKGQMTIHGFRSIASTLLNEQGYRPDVIEAQLAHGDQDAIRSAYNRASYLDERRRMMNEWAIYLDELKNSTN